MDGAWAALAEDGILMPSSGGSFLSTFFWLSAITIKGEGRGRSNLNTRRQLEGQMRRAHGTAATRHGKTISETREGTIASKRPKKDSALFIFFELASTS